MRTTTRTAMHTLLAAALVALAIGTPAIEAPRVAAQGAGGQITGDVPSSGGFALVVWTGGPATELRAAAQARGCALRSAWVTRAGGLLGYVFGAPDFVNSGFASTFPGLVLPAGQALIVVCEGPPSPAMRSSDIVDFAFEPVVEVPVGTTVTWVNRDQAPHNVIDSGGAFASRVFNYDERFSHRFDAPGRFQYYCSLHANMVGYIDVR